MKQISTGAGLVALSVGMVATAFIASHRSGGEAFAQGAGSDRRIVSASVLHTQYGALIAYRIWSDNSIDIRALPGPIISVSHSDDGWGALNYPATGVWRTLDNGTSGFRPLTDVDSSGEVDGGDMAAILMDWNQRQQDTSPPPIDCNINAPR